MKLSRLLEFATNKHNFTKLEHFTDFSQKYISFSEEGLQARIVCRKEPEYQFWQYKSEGTHNITRPINTDLMLGPDDASRLSSEFHEILADPRSVRSDKSLRALIRNGIYTIQQTIGATLDALPATRSNTARKLNGDLFERLIQLIIHRAGVDCKGGTAQVPIVVDGEELCKMNYQHDLMIRLNDELRCIGSVKTSSKDRIDKIFIDKFLLNKLTGVDTPHIAIFLNDVQRTGKDPLNYRVGSTFLPGHFKGYTVKLNPLDGVFYCDLRPNMLSDPYLATRISTIDKFLCEDLWKFLARKGLAAVKIAEDEDTKELEE